MGRGRRVSFFYVLILFVIGLATSLPPQTPARPQPEPQHADRAPVIDGILAEEEWQAPLTTGDWLSYNPLHGDRVPQLTTVWFSFDADYLYFAFKCDDPDPGA